MAFWAKKKLNNKTIDYFEEKNIVYEIEDGQNTRIKFQLCFPEKKIMIYPYLTIDDDIVSININISQRQLRGYDYLKLNSFNIKSKYFKAYILENGIVVLEYRFNDVSKLNDKLNILIDSLYSLQNDIDEL